MILRTAALLATIALLSAFPSFSSAGYVTYTSQASFDAAKAGALFPYRFTNFDSTATGNKTSSFSLDGIGFAGSTENSPGSPGSPVPLDLGVNAAAPAGTTASTPNYLGINGGFGDFQGGSGFPGDKLTITVPANSRAIGLNIITDSVPDNVTHFGTLAIGATTVNIAAGTGTALGSGFSSYFVGIIGQLPADVFSTSTVSFTGNFFRVDNVGIYAVPEPSSLALVAVAGLTGLVRRRVRRA